MLIPTLVLCCLILLQALADQAGQLSGREAAQAIWGIARLRRADKPALDALVRAAKCVPSTR
jgi:hypothetical protein